MNPMNELLQAATNKAIGALRFLDQAGATVIDIQVRNARPVITLDGPPPTPIKGALHKSSPLGLCTTQRVMVAVVQGCQVQWIVRTVRAAPGAALEG
jgi:hypothetical protein